MVLFKMNLLIKCKDYFYKLGEIEQSDDGSIYLFLISESGEFKKTSIHSSGRINYCLQNKKVLFIEPISQLSKPFWICSLFVPNISKLLLVNDINDKQKNIIFQFDQETHFTLNFKISNTNINEDYESLLSIMVLNNTFLNISITPNKFDCNADEHIIFYSPKKGKFERQLIDRFESEKEFRNLLFQNNEAIIFGPNENGELLLHFSNVMRTTPFIKIKFENDNLFVDKISGNKTKVRFYVKNKKYGNQIVKKREFISIIGLSLDAEIYDNEFIPEGYIKIDEIL